MEKPIVFCIMPFNEECLALFKYLKEHFIETFNFINAGDMDNQQNILKDIVIGISKANVIIADVTGLNANVFYELGLAHAMNKKVIIITQQIDEVPFDIKSYRTNEYSLLFYKIPKLIEELEKLLNGAIDDSIKYGNPVSDFSPICISSQPTITQNTAENTTTNDNNDSECDVNQDDGFLDNITNINDSLNSMTDEIYTINAEMDEMSNATKITSQEIDRVSAQSGNTDPAFVRNVCRKLSVPISDFANKLNVHTDNIAQYWSKVENNYLSLLENPFTCQVRNKSEIENAMDSLLGLKGNILESNKEIENLSNVMYRNRGIERKLTKAINEAVNGLNSFLSMTNTIVSSIDRIESKGSIVISSLSEKQE